MVRFTFYSKCSKNQLLGKSKNVIPLSLSHEENFELTCNRNYITEPWYLGEHLGIDAANLK